MRLLRVIQLINKQVRSLPLSKLLMTKMSKKTIYTHQSTINSSNQTNMTIELNRQRIGLAAEWLMELKSHLWT